MTTTHTDLDIATATSAQLVAIYNALVEDAHAAGLSQYRTVSRFADRDSGVKRIVALRSSLRAAASIPADTTTQPQEPTVTKHQEPTTPAVEQVAQPVNGEAPVQPKEKAKRVRTGETLLEQMARYNALATEANAAGVKARILGVNGTTFASRAAGDAAIAKLKARLEEAATATAAQTAANGDRPGTDAA